MKQSKYLLMLAALLVSSASSREMPSGSEQFYVAQGLFGELELEPLSCWMNDPVINFACGQYKGDVESFKSRVDAYVSSELPGLFKAVAWFGSGNTTVQDYRSVEGSYLIGYNPGGYVVIAFTPR